MALVNCPECNKKVSETAAACPSCGFAVSNWTQADSGFEPNFDYVEDPNDRATTPNKDPGTFETVMGCGAAIAIFIFCCIPGGSCMMDQREKDEAREQAKVEAQKQAAAAKAERQHQLGILEADFPQLEPKRRAELDAIQKAVDEGNQDEAQKLIDALDEKLVPYRPIKSPPDELVALRADFDKVKGQIEAQKALELLEQKEWLSASLAFDRAKKLGFEAPEHNEARAKAHTGIASDIRKSGDKAKKEKEWLDAESKYIEASAELDKVPEDDRDKAHAREAKRIAGRIKSIKKKADRAREKQAERKLYEAACGEAPEIDGWDGGNYKIERYVKSAAHDPSSIDIENCHNLVFTEKNCWRLTCVVVGKNAFNAQVKSVHNFWIGAGMVVKSDL